VKKKDLNAWLADVDQSDPAFAKEQRQQFENLTKLPFAELTYERTVQSAPKLAAFLPSQLFARYHAAVKVVAVSVRHRIEGMDTRTVATPWLAVFGLDHGRWVIAGDGRGRTCPRARRGSRGTPRGRSPWSRTIG